MLIAVEVEKQFKNSIWYTEYLRGIKHEASLQAIRLAERHEDYTIRIGSSPEWLYRRGPDRNSILISPDIAEIEQFSSCVSVNFYLAMNKTAAYLADGHKNHTVLFGVNPLSLGDTAKMKSFLNIFPHGNVYRNSGNIGEATQELISDIETIDSVICCNGLISVYLCRELINRGISVPDDVWVMSFGSTLVGQLTSPAISYIDCDYFTVGRQAVKVCKLLEKNAQLASVNLTIDAKIISSDSTGNKPDSLGNCELLHSKFGTSNSERSSFYQDAEIQQLTRLERLFARCRACDIGILEGISKKIRYIDLADGLNVSENTLKYRLRRMLDITDLGTKEELLRQITEYFSFDELSKSGLFLR